MYITYSNVYVYVTEPTLGSMVLRQTSLQIVKNHTMLRLDRKITREIKRNGSSNFRHMVYEFPHFPKYEYIYIYLSLYMILSCIIIHTLIVMYYNVLCMHIYIAEAAAYASLSRIAKNIDPTR